MEAARVKSLTTRVPAIRRSFDFATTSTQQGANFRIKIALFSVLPLLYCFDQNTGLARLGFASTALERQFSVRPDYLTNTVFMAERRTVPSFKNL